MAMARRFPVVRMSTPTPNSHASLAQSLSCMYIASYDVSMSILSAVAWFVIAVISWSVLVVLPFE